MECSSASLPARPCRYPDGKHTRELSCLRISSVFVTRPTEVRGYAGHSYSNRAIGRLRPIGGAIENQSATDQLNWCVERT